MSAAVLRKAAALMRERATFATWVDFDNKSDWSGDVAAMDLEREYVDHVMSWSPAIALAVANWLEMTALDHEGGLPMLAQALTVARAYLGSDA